MGASRKQRQKSQCQGKDQGQRQDQNQDHRINGGGNENGNENSNVVECPPPKCQCTSDCKNPVKEKDTFCEYHKNNGCPIVHELSGYEPEYKPDEYNEDKAIQHSHNCFAYALGVKDSQKIEKCRYNNDCKFHVPGKTKDHPEFSGRMGKSCSDVIGRTMADIPQGYVVNFPTQCNKGFSKIGIVVDKKKDLHYYRVDKPKKNDTSIYTTYVPEKPIGLWSHKPGARKVTDKDAYGAKIYRPDLASRCYPKETPEDNGLNYNSFCSYMCVPRDTPNIIAGGHRYRKHTKNKYTSSRMTTRKNLRNVRKSRKNTRKSGGGLFRSKPTLYIRNRANTRKVSNPTISNNGKINYSTVKNALLKKNTTPFAYQGYSSHTGQNQGYLSRSGQNIRRLGFNQKVLEHINSNKVANNVLNLVQNMNYNTKNKLRTNLIKLSKAANKNSKYDTEYIEKLNLMYSDPALRNFLKNPSPNHTIGM